ncbi:GntR family transcriptional regulator [Sporosarcina ureilytica]|uniref:GntR family transcriptional regulator n=1 Tax=Sporosarcina ureilytica TaxID=298596 RepID=A0A1D8JHP6_9BACL|nr:GntR family transcriptional regulator [Sporosarcina ureilytica]AOV08218.1 GntR family transcriptional regulator [Sporosarcina ureilytica]
MENADQGKTYKNVIEQLKRDIESGVIKANERIPNEFELAKSLGVSLATLRKALQILESEKVVVRKHGVGTFVNPKPLFTSGIEELTSVTTMIEQAGMESGTILMDVSETDATDASIKRFNYGETDKIITIKRLRTADGQPVVFCIDQVLAKNFPVGADELLKTSIFDAIEQSGDIRITQAVAQIEPIDYDEEASSLLRCGIDIPLLALIQKHYSDDGEMVLYSKNYFRADKFSFHVVRKRV